MSKITSFALAGMMALVLALQGRADTPAAEPKSDKPAATAEAKPAAPLTDESLKMMLENMGYDLKAETAGKAIIYHLTFDQDGWTYRVQVALSSDKQMLWISTGVASLPADEMVPAAMLLRLLEENNNIGPSAIAYEKANKHISLALPLTNRGGLTPAVFRANMSDFLANVKSAKKLCDFPKPDDKAEAKKMEEKTEAKK